MTKARNLSKLLVDSSGDVDLSSLDNVDALPSQSGQSGKFLTTDGTNASWATVTMPDEIRDPVNSSPANGSGGQLDTPTLTSSAFRSLYGETHSKSQWQVSTASDFSTTVVSTGDSNSLTSYTISSGVLSPSTTYYWRVRYKDSNGTYSDWSTATTFITVSSFSYSVEYLVVAGGGGGGGWVGGGGGAGGYRSAVAGEQSGGGASAEAAPTLTAGTAYTVTIGAGGAGSSIGAGPTTLVTGSGGNNSVFGSITSIGGGRGASWSQVGATSGGSGGGYDYNQTGSRDGATGQGFSGGNGTDVPNYAGGGGGGAGAVGSNATTVVAGDGGVGVQSSINGTATYRSGGGGGGLNTPVSGSRGGFGGLGGGGDGRQSNGVSGVADQGDPNTGGGGGGDGLGGPSTNTTGGNGGSGIVIIRYLGAQRGTGGTVTSSGGYTIHTFTSSGTYTS